MGNMAKAELPAAVVADLGARLDALKEEIEALKEIEPPKGYTRDQIGAWLESLKEAPADKAIQLLAERIDVNKKGFHIESTRKSIPSGKP